MIVRSLCRGIAIFAWALVATDAAAMERVVYRRDGKEATVEGRIVVEAQDGGLLLQSKDGALWTLPPEEIVERNSNETPFASFSMEELGARMLGELPPGFQIHETKHYVICYDTSEAYAEWCGALFEQLHRAFTNYWERRDFDLKPVEFPLVAVVFADRSKYAAYAEPELGEATPNVIGYYSLQSNRMNTFDLTGIEALRNGNDRRKSSDQINDVLSQPAAERTVATIIHEATHQLAFNCGLHARYADIPLWVSEGMAVYFETPSFKKKAWSINVGVNRVRHAGFRDYLARRTPGSLQSLIAEDKRFRAAHQGNDAYSEAWALNYFLMKQRPKQFREYLKELAEKKPLLFDQPEERLAAFQKAFGDDFEKLDADFLKYMSKVRF